MKQAQQIYFDALKKAGLHPEFAHFEQLLSLISSYSKISLESLKQSRPIRVPLSLNGTLIQPLIDIAARYHEIPGGFSAQEMILAGVP